MCKDCGCQEGNEKKYFDHHHHKDHGHYHNGVYHTHDNGHEHHHHHEVHIHSHKRHEHSHEYRMQTKEEGILSRDEEFVHRNKHYLKDRGIVTVNIISSRGSGKTTLLEKTLEALKEKIHCSVIISDQCSDDDAKRLEGKCDCVYQIETKSSMYLDAEQISEILPQVVDDKTRLLFIENILDLTCPAASNLGEDFKVALLSVAEGEDNPVKYPSIFSDASVAVITKTDLTPHLGLDIRKCRNYFRQVNPGIYIFEVSFKTGEGMPAWIKYLQEVIS